MGVNRRPFPPGTYLAEQQQLVKRGVEARAGLVDGGDDRAAALRQALQDLQHVHRRRAVQACGPGGRVCSEHPQ